MDISENTVLEKPKKKCGFTLKQRILPSVLLAFAVSFTLCLFGPFDIFINNADHFRFVMSDFIWLCILCTLGGTAVFTAILLPLRGKAFDIVYAILFWLTIMLFIQGNYLNAGFNSLAADGVGDGNPFTVSRLIVNTSIWVVVGAAIVLAVIFLKQKYHDLIRLVGIVAMISVIGMQLITGGVSALTALSAPEEEPSAEEAVGEETEEPTAFLTYENLNEVGDEKNIIYFVVDRFAMEFYENYGLTKCPEIFYNMDGFTYFDNAISLYPRTYPSVPYMLTGVENNFTTNRADYLNNAYENAEFLKLLKQEGYDINIYTDRFYGYDNASSMEDYVSNLSSSTEYTVKNRWALVGDMLRLSLYRYFPVSLKGTLGSIGTATFDKHIVYSSDFPEYTTDMKNVYEFLQNNALEDSIGEKNFSFFHTAGIHIPNDYDEYFNPAVGDKKNDPVVALKQTFKIINLYIDQLKALGLYEDATIIITGDHTSITRDEDFLYPHSTALFVKPSGSAGTPLKTSSAPVTHEDLFATVLWSEGIETEKDYGKTVFDFEEGEYRERRYRFQRRGWINGSIGAELIEALVIGPARDPESWHIVSDGTYVGDVYD